MKTVTLTTCNDVVEANLIVGRLKNEGIYAFTTNENSTTVMPHYNNMFGAGVQIVVLQQDLQKAKEIIEPDINKKILCPECGSDNIKFGLGHNVFKTLFFVILSAISFIPMGNIKTKCICCNCKHEFRL